MLFKKSYDQIVKGFTKVEKDLRELEVRETEKSVALDREIGELRTERNAAMTEAVHAAKTADKLEEFFGNEEATNES